MATSAMDSQGKSTSGEGENETMMEDTEIDMEKDEYKDNEEEIEDGEENPDTDDEVTKQLKTALNSIVFDRIEEKFEPTEFPESYKANMEKEKKVLKICKDFLFQYNHLCNRRQPLFLKPLNEFGVEKCVCTTICPTQLPYRTLIDWQEISTFVSDHLNYDRLEVAYELPKTLHAPQTTLLLQHGHCFEYSTLLCSMLIGSGYDAFVVSGYATAQVSKNDQSYTLCPCMELDQIVMPKSLDINVCRYTVRPPKQLNSEYVLRMKMKNDVEKKAIRLQQQRQSDIERELREAPPLDRLRGLRVHSWVLVLAGFREVTEPFFIEPTTGLRHKLNWDGYLGVESLWNHRNYYINMQQEKISGIKDLKWDIGDSRDWEYIFVGQDIHQTMTMMDKIDRDNRRYMQGDHCEEELPLDLPYSWTNPLKLSIDRWELRYPEGSKTIRYKCSLVERYSEYLNPDGLVFRLKVYTDLECTDLKYTKEHYSRRSDLLKERFFDNIINKVYEYFLIGRPDFLLEHHYFLNSNLPEKDRIMVFQENKRVDELYKREESPTFLKQWFGSRSDLLIYRETVFGPNGKIREKNVPADARPIESLTERYSRNPDLLANEDVAEVTFKVTDDTIHITYHVPEDKIVACTRMFQKPEKWWDDTQYLEWSPTLHTSFDTDFYPKPLNELKLFQMMVKFMKHEAAVRDKIRITEKEIKSMLRVRANEEDHIKLVKTFLQADRIPATRKARLAKKEKDRLVILMKKSDILRDYLEPYLFRLGIDQVTNKKQAIRIMDDCLHDLKERLVNWSSMIKQAYVKEKILIEKAQIWIHDNFVNVTTEQMEKYRLYLVQHFFKAQVLENRLIVFKEYAPIKYHELYDVMKADPRLVAFV